MRVIVFDPQCSQKGEDWEIVPLLPILIALHSYWKK